MKTKLLLLITTFFLQFANAQMDDKFYYPNKVINPITLPHEEFSLKVEQDFYNRNFFKKENPKATLYFFMAWHNTLYFLKKW
jgi:hypothetical protein